MAVTVADILADAREIYRDLPVDADLIKIFNDVHSDICADIRLYQETTYDISLVAETQEYARNENILRIWSCSYLTSATAGKRLLPTSIDELDYENPTWRLVNSGVPFRFYESGGIVGFYFKPNQTTAAGYPKVTLYCSAKHDLTTADSLPTQVTTGTAWIYGLIYKWACRRHVEEAELREALYRKEKNNIAVNMQGVNARNKPSAVYNVPRIQH